MYQFNFKLSSIQRHFTPSETKFPSKYGTDIICTQFSPIPMFELSPYGCKVVFVVNYANGLQCKQVSKYGLPRLRLFAFGVHGRIVGTSALL